jgi:hypothetical protein
MKDTARALPTVEAVVYSRSMQYMPVKIDDSIWFLLVGPDYNAEYPLGNDNGAGNIVTEASRVAGNYVELARHDTSCMYRGPEGCSLTPISGIWTVAEGSADGYWIPDSVNTRDMTYIRNEENVSMYLQNRAIEACLLHETYVTNSFLMFAMARFEPMKSGNRFITVYEAYQEVSNPFFEYDAHMYVPGYESKLISDIYDCMARNSKRGELR